MIGADNGIGHQNEDFKSTATLKKALLVGETFSWKLIFTSMHHNSDFNSTDVVA